MATRLKAISVLTIDYWRTLYMLPATESFRASARGRRLIAAGRIMRLNDDDPVVTQFFTFIDGVIKSRWKDGLSTPTEILQQKWLSEFPGTTAHMFRTFLSAVEAAYLNEIRPQLMDGAADFLRWCSTVKPIYLISDTYSLTGRVLRRIMQEDAILQLFTDTFFSDETGVKKPDLSAFYKILKREGCPASALLHIGDEAATDLLAIERLGGWCVYVNNGNPTPVSDRIIATVGTFAEAGRCVQELLLSVSAQPDNTKSTI